jgi:hypothetical protein
MELDRFELFIGRRATGVSVCRDECYPQMWRIRDRDGTLSDMVNLARAKDAAIGRARPRGLGGSDVLTWKARLAGAAASPVR